jgi:hypothetical protein
MVNPNPRRKRHLAETKTIAKTEMISKMKTSRPRVRVFGEKNEDLSDG